jgi:hypothetical protein
MPHSQSETGRQIAELVSTWGASALPIEGPLLEALHRGRQRRLGKRLRLARARDLLGEGVAPELLARVRAVLEDPSGYATTEAIERDLRGAAGERLRAEAATLRADLAKWTRHLSPEPVQSCWGAVWAPLPGEALEDALDALETMVTARATLEGARSEMVKGLRAKAASLVLAGDAAATVQRAITSAAPEDLGAALAVVVAARSRSESDLHQHRAKEAPANLAERLRRLESAVASPARSPAIAGVVAEAHRTVLELEQRQLAPVAADTWIRALEDVETAARRAEALTEQRAALVSAVVEHLAHSSPALEGAPELAGIAELLNNSADGASFHATLLEVLRISASARAGGSERAALVEKLRGAAKELAGLLERSGEELPVERVAQARLWLEQLDEPIAAGDPDRISALLRAIEHDTQLLESASTKARGQRRGRAGARREALREKLELLKAVASSREVARLDAFAARLGRMDEEDEVAASAELARLGLGVERRLRVQAARTLARAQRAGRPAAAGLAEALRGEDLKEIVREEARLRRPAGR